MDWDKEQQETIAKLSHYIKKGDQIVHVNSSFKIETEQIEDPLLKSLIQFLLVDDLNAFKKLSERHPSLTMFSERKLQFLKKVRAYFQETFIRLEPFLNAHKEQQLWGEIFTGHLLAYFTFLSPEEGEHLKVPVFKEGKWQLVQFQIEKIHLTPRWMGSFAVAFGLKTDTQREQILLFKGTAYPTDEGFIKQLLADVTPFASVGRLLFYFGKEKLKKWFSTHPSTIYGASLGGALSQHAANAFPEKSLRVFAYNPPALLDHEIASLAKAEVNVISNLRDIVTKSGSKRSSNCKIYQVIPLKPRNFLLAHVECFEAFEKHLILLKQPRVRGFFDYFITWGHLILSIPLFILGTILSIFLLPFVRKN